LYDESPKLTDYDRGLEVNDVNGLSEEDILRTVLTQDTDQPDSDEDEHDDYATPQITAADAMGLRAGATRVCLCTA
jgi:hypothetical protein